MKDQMASTDANKFQCDDCIARIATVAPLSRHRLADIANGSPASRYEKTEIRRAERLTGVHMPDDCASCPHAGEDECCGGAV